ncbi:MAG: Stk1 family PASTA domain-containing Ser/Thr kinase [Actinomycetota bacterium]
MRRLETPTQIAGRYDIVGRIGSGGMGDVLRARDSVLGRTVALKILPFELAIQPGFVERFRAEAQAVARISHANVVQVHDWGQENDSYYMVMEYVRGRNLRQILAGRSSGRLYPKQAAQVTGQVLGALSAAHAKGVVHRDVKPENVMVATDGRVKVADFGIARALERAAFTGGMLGTVAYVAPEQARGEAVDQRADLYSTGCMLYELLTGSLPFEGDAAKVLQEHLNGRVPAPSALVPSVGPELDRIVLKATAPLPQDRYQSASEMRKDLAAVMTGLPEAPPLSDLTGEFTSEVASEHLATVVRQKRPKRKRRWIKWGLSLLVIGLVAGGIFVLEPTRVPSVLGISRTDAAKQLEQAALEPRFKDVFSDTTPGTVIDTKPAVGAWTRRGVVVAVEVSAGPKLSDVPAVVGMLEEQAKQAILDVDLSVGSITRRNDREPLGKVLDQSPKPSTVRSRDPVSLVISDGPAILDVPNLSGKPVAEAEKLLNDLGFVPVSAQVFNGAPAGTVTIQLPPAGEKHPQGTQVAFQVSKGPEPFKMPDVKGKACSEVKAQLEGLGMKVVAQSPSGGEGSCGGNKVLEQDPLPQSTRKPGNEATLYVG